MRKSLLRWSAAIILIGTISIGVVIGFAEYDIVRSTQSHVYDDIESLPERNVGLLLGTSKYISDGRINLFYAHRITAAASLYEAEKINYILVSGDNSVVTYNEPDTMKADLISAGIPEERIFVDYAGFDTLDSIIRARSIFLQDDPIIISQRFHNQRAVYIANHNEMNAVAFNAEDVPVSKSPRVWLRERLARVKALFDVITNAQPKFLGDTIAIPSSRGE